jgi:uncharacterized membrane protein YcaP (DUF421 family)
VFLGTLLIVRCGDRRFLSQKTAFDAVLGFILASMLARAVNGTAAFFSNARRRSRARAAASATGILVSSLARTGGSDKGRSDVIVRDGILDEVAARRNRVSEHDLLEDLRLNGNVGAVADASLAELERNGYISAVRRVQPQQP